MYWHTIYNNSCPEVSSVRDLGVFVSKTLKFSEHCSKIARQGFRKVNLIFRCFKTRDVTFLVKVYTTFVRPGLEYASEIWSPHYIRDIELIERVQRLFTRRLPCFSTERYEYRLNYLGLKSLRQRRIAKDLIMVFRIVHGLVDLDFDAFFAYSQFCSWSHKRS